MPLYAAMVKVSDDVWLAGVDGCRGGWLPIFVRADGSEVRMTGVVGKFGDVLAAPEAPVLIAVDMPIGLPERVGRGGRAAENAVRPVLGKRKSSVFSVPSRRAVFAEVGPFTDQQSRYAAHQRACVIARATSDPPRGITIFAFGLLPKIREVDAVLRRNRELHDRVRETHPELAFWRLNGERPLCEPKKTKPGLALRRHLLIKAGFRAAIVNGEAPAGAGPDDLLDALACAAIARRIHSRQAQSFPDPYERDAVGLPMAIWA